MRPIEYRTEHELSNLIEQSVGVLADGKHDIRVAFSAVDIGQLEDLFAQMGAAAKDLAEGSGTK